MSTYGSQPDGAVRQQLTVGIRRSTNFPKDSASATIAITKVNILIGHLTGKSPVLIRGRCGGPAGERATFGIECVAPKTGSCSVTSSDPVGGDDDMLCAKLDRAAVES